MAGILKVTPEKLKNTASSLESTGTQIKKITQQMTTLITALKGNTWSGEASDSYGKKFNDLQNDINTMIKMIQEHVTDLNNMASQYEKTESLNLSAIQSLSSDVVR